LKEILASFLLITLIVLTSGIGNVYAVDYGLEVTTNPPNFLHIDGTGKYEANTFVTTGTAPEEYDGFRLVGWKVDGVMRLDNPAKIYMDKSHTAVAVYSSTKSLVTVDSIPRVTSIVVDGTVYQPSSLPLAFDWEDNSMHKISIEQSVTDNSTRYVFSNWSNLATDRTINLMVDGDIDLNSLYNEEHYVVISSPYGKTTGTGWYEPGESADFSLSEKLVNGDEIGSRHIFTGWNTGHNKNSLENSLIVTEPTVVEATWKDQYLLDIISTGPDVNFEGAGWYDENTVATLVAKESLESESKKVKYEFEGWQLSSDPKKLLGDDDFLTPLTIKMDAPKTVLANWNTFYYLDILDPYDEIEGEGYYESGTYVKIELDSTERIIKDDKIKVVLDNFGDEYDENIREILMDEPKTVDVNGGKQYYLDVVSKFGTTSGSGWYEEGETAVFSVDKLRDPAGLWMQHLFAGWSGDFKGSSKTGTIVMDSPKTVSVIWKEDITVAYMNSLIIMGTLGGAGLIFMKIRKTKKEKHEQWGTKKSGFGNLVSKINNQKKFPPSSSATLDQYTDTKLVSPHSESVHEPSHIETSTKSENQMDMNNQKTLNRDSNDNRAPEIVSSVIGSINVNSEKTDLSNFQSSDLGLVREWLTELMFRKLNDDQNSRVIYEKKLIEIINSEIESRTKIQTTNEKQSANEKIQIEIHAACTFKPNTGVFEVDAFISEKKPTDEEIRGKKFSYVWKDHFHLMVKDRLFSKTLGSDKNPLPDSLMNLDKVWVIVIDRLSPAYTVIDIKLSDNLKNSQPKVVEKSSEVKSQEQTKPIENTLEEENKSSDKDVTPVIQQVIKSIDIESDTNELFLFETQDLRQSYNWLCKVLSKKLANDKSANVNYESALLKAIHNEVLIRTPQDNNNSIPEISSPRNQSSKITKVEQKPQSIPSESKKMSIKLDLNDKVKQSKVQEKPTIQKLIEMAKKKRGGYRRTGKLTSKNSTQVQ